MSWNLIRGDCVPAMHKLADEGQHFHAIVTDPPYDLTTAREKDKGIAGQEWDAQQIAFDPATWKACLDVLLPGGHLVALGAPRTYHRMAVAVEDAGFEIRDQITWKYPAEFSKSRNISKDIDWLGGYEGLLIRQEIAQSIESSGLSDVYLARLVGRSNNLVKAWRQGTRNITAADAAKLSRVFDCPVPKEVERTTAANFRRQE